MSEVAAEVRDEREIEADALPPGGVPPGAPPVKKRGPVGKVLTENQEKDARTVVQWLREIGTAGKQMQLQLYRIKPTQYMGQDISGFIRRFDEEIDEEQIKAMFGGGKYQIKLNLPDDKGVFRFSTAHSFEISGPPKMVEDDQSRRSAEPREDSSVVKNVLDTMSRQLDKAEDRASRGGGADADSIARAVEMATRPLYSTIDRLTTQVEMAQKAANDARTAPPDPVRDRVMDKLLTDDTSRMESLRMAHTAETNTLRQSAIDLEARLRDKHERELTEIRSDHKTERERSERQHERELTEVKRSFESQISDLKRSYDSQIQILRDAHTREITSLTTVNTITGKVSEGDTKRLERDNSDLRVEIKALREKKDKSIFEIVKEVEEIKETLGVGDGDEKKGWERAIEAVGNLPAIQKVVGKLAGTDANGQAQQQLPPPHVPFVGQDGQTYVHDGQGNFSIVQQRRRLKPRGQRPPAPPPPPPAPPADASPEVVQQHQQATEQHAAAVKEAQIAQAVATIDPAQVALAVAYLEQAFQKYRGGADPNFEPKTVASSIRSQGLAPAAVIQFLKDQGVDVLLEKVARLEASSPFKTQAGINWIRKVAKELA